MANQQNQDKFLKLCGEGNYESVANLYSSEQSLIHSKDRKTGETALQFAAKGGNLQLFQFLERNGASADEKDKNGWTPLITASRNGSLSIVQHLIEGGTYQQRDKDGRTLMHYAIRYGHINVVDFLISRDFPVTEKDAKDGWTGLHYASQYNQIEIAKLLLKSGSSLGETDKTGKTALHIAVIRANQDMAKFLVGFGASLTVKDKAGMTALHLGASKGNNEMVEFLVNNVDDTQSFVNEKAENGVTAIHYAARKGNDEMIRYLASKGSHLDQEDDFGMTVLSYAVYKGHDNILDFLVQNGIDLEKKDKAGKTVLHNMANKGEFNKVRKLIDLGSKVDGRDNNGNTALHYAVKRGHTEIMEYLVEQGSSYTETDNNGVTVLEMAASENNQECLKYLVSQGLSIMNKDKDISVSDLKTWVIKPEAYLLLNLLAKMKTTAKVLEERSGYTLWHLVALGSYIDIMNTMDSETNEIEGLLEDKKKTKEVDKKTMNDDSAVHFAALQNNHRVVDFLLGKNAKIMESNKDGMRPTHIAAANGNQEVFESLFKSSSTEDVNNADNSGKTVLHHAAANGLLKITKMVLETGQVKFFKADKNERLAMHYACENGNDEIAKALINKMNQSEVENLVNSKDSTGLVPFDLAFENNHDIIVKLLLDHNAGDPYRVSNGSTSLIEKSTRDKWPQLGLFLFWKHQSPSFFMNFIKTSKLEMEFLEALRTIGLYELLKSTEEGAYVEEFLTYLIVLAAQHKDSGMISEICIILLNNQHPALNHLNGSLDVGKILHSKDCKDGYSAIYYANEKNQLLTGLELLHVEKTVHTDQDEGLKCIRENAGYLQLDHWLIDSYKLVHPAVSKINAFFMVCFNVLLSFIFFFWDWATDIWLCIQYRHIATDTDYESCEATNDQDIPCMTQTDEDVKYRFTLAFWVMVVTIGISFFAYFWAFMKHKPKEISNTFWKIIFKILWPFLYLRREFNWNASVDKTDLDDPVHESKKIWTRIKTIENGMENFLQMMLQLYLMKPYVSELTSLSFRGILSNGLIGVFNLSDTVCHGNYVSIALGKLFLSLLSLSYGASYRQTNKPGISLGQTIKNLVLWLSFFFLSIARVLALFSLIALNSSPPGLFGFLIVHIMCVALVLKDIILDESSDWSVEYLKKIGKFLMSCFASNTFIIIFQKNKRGKNSFKTQLVFQTLILVENVLLMLLPYISTDLYPSGNCYHYSINYICSIIGSWLIGIILQIVYYKCLHPTGGLNGKYIPQSIKTQFQRITCCSSLQKENETIIMDDLKKENNNDEEKSFLLGQKGNDVKIPIPNETDNENNNH